MAAPFAHEDLEKLKKFIEFVSANPLILNMPQLDFVRKFIEQFGGTIPAGDFQMPAGGGKCPFGGDAKAEPKPAPEQDEAPEDMVDDEEESEESELELDMEETCGDLFEPNVLYLDEKPPIIVNPPKKARTKQKMAKKKKVDMKKEPLTPTAKVRKSKQLSPPAVLTVKEELEKDNADSAGYDPLSSPQEEIKMEIEFDDEFEIDKQPVFDYYTNDETVDSDEKYDSFADDDEDYETKLERGLADEENAESDEVTDDEEEDDPLIMLAKRRGRPRVHHQMELGKIKAPRMVICREICKHHCNRIFTEEQRLLTCDNFWSLSKEDRVQYIRKHILAKRFTRLKRKTPTTRGNNRCYYLDGNDSSSEFGNMIRVCRKYFVATLCVSNHIIKKALIGYKPEPEFEIKRLSEQKREERKKAACTRPKEIRQILDSETGNLLTIDPNVQKLKTCETGPKKKIRKPGDPIPEHFPKPIKCELRCIFKCHTQFTEDERKQICDLFWSFDYKRRKDFVLAHIKTKDVENQLTPEFRKSNRPPRVFHTKYFLSSGVNGENKRVCKHFMMSTLSISHVFIQNALEFADKTTGFYTGTDMRGHNKAPNEMMTKGRQAIFDHINSYATWVPNKKSKTRYLYHKLNIKQMYDDYKSMSMEQQMKVVARNAYYKSFHDDFRLSFLCYPEPKRGVFGVLNPNISHYTGNEPGGFWVYPNGEKLDTGSSMIDLTQNFMRFPRLIDGELLSTTQTTAASVPVDDDASLCTTTANPTVVDAP